jgi:AcrR family transcriptional regulator
MAKEIKNEKILKAAEKVYKSSGLEKTTVTDICDAADISRKTFYQRFKNLDELLEVLIEYISKKAVSQLYDGEKSENSINLLWKIFDIYDEIVKSHPILHTVYRSKYSRWVDWNESGFADKFESVIRKKIEDIIKQGKKKGELREDIKEDNLSYLITLTLSNIHFVIIPSLTDEKQGKELIETLKEIIKKGILQK